MKTEIDAHITEAKFLMQQVRESMPELRGYGNLGEALANEIEEDLVAADMVLKECGDVPIPRTHSGGSGVMYLDAILRMVDGLTEVVELVIMGLKLYLKVVRKLREWSVKEEKAGEELDDSAEEAEQGMSFFEKARNELREAALAVGAKVEPVVASMAAPIALAADNVMEAGYKAEAKAWLNVMKARNEFAKASDYAIEATIVKLEGALAITRAVIKLIQVVRRTIAWAKQLLSVELVMLLPIPISGWDVLRYYKWITVDEVPDILAPVVVNVVNGNYNPRTIVQGVLRTATVRSYIPEEVYEAPVMDYLGNGSVF